MLAVALWALVFLAVIDFTLGVVFAYPSDPKVTHVSTFQQYFDYGRSTESKIRRMTRTSVDETAPITRAGWYDPLTVVPVGSASAHKTMTVYGMSHAGLLGQAVARVSPDWRVRLVTAPGATLNWSYGAFLRDDRTNSGNVVVLAVMSTGVGAITSTTPMTSNTDGPIPYTADSFRFVNSILQRTEPPFSSFSGFVSTLFDDLKWRDFKTYLDSQDPWYRPLVFEETVTDRSVLARLIRRAYAQQGAARIQANSLGKQSFDPESEQVVVANAIIEEFTSKARDAGLFPIIYVVNNFGYSDTLFRALQPALTRTKVDVLNSAAIASASDPRNYLPDSHFTVDVDNELARHLVKQIEVLEH